MKAFGSARRKPFWRGAVLTLIPALLLLAALLPGLCKAGDLALRGVWVSTVYNLDYPSRAGLSASSLRQEADEIIRNAADWGMNAIFLQVRPAADALYASDYFPWSAWLTGSQGTPPPDDFDPLDYFVREAHAAGIELHAWINPYRVTRQRFDSRDAALASLAPGHPAHSMPDALVWHEDGSLYFDPGDPAARQLIVDGVRELVEKYDVDGVHLDDYFYPGGEFDDAAAFAAYGQAFSSRGDFRRESVNQLIQTLYGLIQTTRPAVRFGVSPFGVWANSSTHPQGSNTAGASSYFDMYADSRTWVQEGMVDYIMPQLYWHIGSKEADFDTLLQWWCNVTAGTGVDLYIGLAAYRVTDAAEGTVWYGTDELHRQMDRVADSPAAGICMFRYGSVRSTAALSVFSAEYLGADPSPAPGRLPLPATYPQDFSLDTNVAVLKEQPLELTYRVPYGSRVTVAAGGQQAVLEAQPGGLYTGSLSLEGETAGQPLYPLAVCTVNDFLFVDIINRTITPVEAEEPARITQILSADRKDGGQQLTFFTGTPVAAQVLQRGTAIQISLEPCKMGVLFENSFLEALDVKTEDGVTTYTLILPRNSRNFLYDLQWYSDRIVLDIRPQALPQS